MINHNIQQLTEISYLVSIVLENEDALLLKSEFDQNTHVGETGYLKDIDFNSDPDEEGYLVKDAQGSVRAIVNVTYSGGAYSVTTERYNTDGYGAWLDFDAAHTNGTHYMRYISCRVEDFCDSGSTNDNQALYHTDHRHYLPFLGIFLQREPLIVWASKEYADNLSTTPGNLYPYRYTANHPTLTIDTSGLQGEGCNQEEYDKCEVERDNKIAWCRDYYHALMDFYNDCIDKIEDWLVDVYNWFKGYCSGKAYAVYVECTGTGKTHAECVGLAIDEYNKCMRWYSKIMGELWGKTYRYNLMVLNCWKNQVASESANCENCAFDEECRCKIRARCACYLKNATRNILQPGPDCHCDLDCPSIIQVPGSGDDRQGKCPCCDSCWEKNTHEWCGDLHRFPESYWSPDYIPSEAPKFPDLHTCQRRPYYSCPCPEPAKHA